MRTETMKRATYTVNMHCEGCAITIKNGLSAVDGVISVDPMLERKKVRVDYDTGKLNSKDIKETIRKLGYQVD